MALKLNKAVGILGRLNRSALYTPASVVPMQKSKNYFTYVNEISHPLERKCPIVSPEEAVSLIKSGKFCYDHAGS